MPPCDVPIKHVKERTAVARFPRRDAPPNRLHSIWLPSPDAWLVTTNTGNSGVEAAAGGDRSCMSVRLALL